MTGDAGNTGDTGDTGDSGISGSAGISGEFGGGWFIADRGDLPFVTALDPMNLPIAPMRVSRSSFGERAWTARWWANLVLHDFVDTNWRTATSYGQSTNQIMDTEWNNVGAPAAEIDQLILAARDERATATGEILSQDVEFNTDFMALLGITPGTHPNTYRMLHIASLIGSYTVLYYKGLRNRPRPSQLCPALLPPIPMPGHASWPSGHATQAWLKALLIEHVLDGPLDGALPGTTHPSGTGNLGTVSSNLRTLAIRVARNREIAGLHYPTDSSAGRKLAEAIAPFLTSMGTGSRFRTTVEGAKGEWPV